MSRILIFSSNPDESRRLADLVRSDDATVVESSSPLTVMHILKTDSIDLVVASQGLSDIEKDVFRNLVETSAPGVSILFTGPPSTDGRIAFSPPDFGRFIRESVALSTGLKDEIKDLKDFSISFADRLLQVFEVDDKYFFNNSNLTAELSEKIARRMGLAEDMVEAVRMVALVKDLGRVGIQHQLLEAERKFDRKEMVSLKKHPINTVEMLKQLNFPWNVEPLIAQHHEHYDGTGYPMGLKGRQISVGARIIHIAESYVAMTAERPYRKRRSKEEALQEIIRKAGSQFDPEIAEIFLAVIKDTPEPAKTSVLLLEREPNVASLLRLGLDTSKVGIISVSNSFDALRLARQRTPDLIMVDVEIFETDTFASFFGRLQSVRTIQDKPFVLIVPDEYYPRRFEGENVHYVSKPVEMSVLISAINKILDGKKARPEKQEDASGLTGTLEDFSIDDIVQILNIGLKTANVEVVSGIRKGNIYTEGGRVVHASVGNRAGKEAFAEMLRWTEGTFRIRHGETTDQHNISMNTMQLLLESAKEQDSSRRYA
ncbi:MAG: DUF4388 domain-containing protein [Nitrospirota bacterium]|jgi:HD-GYP domain-containing protein (c-di-GMP phosphodiesterase class II)